MIPKFEELENKIIIVQQNGSKAGASERQKGTLIGLKIRGIGSKSELKCTKEIYGMLLKISHIIEVKLKKD